MIGIFKGMGITIRHVFRRVITFQYPKEKRNDLAPRFRGELMLRGMMGVTNNGELVDTEVMPPCMANCPSNMKIREYVGLISEGRYQEAVKVMKEDNPLILVCGRVCPHPCEQSCRRGDRDEPVAINNLKRFAADYDLKLQQEGKVKPPKPKITKDKKVAVIGAGPAGLTCAYFLAKMGYPVTIFEKLPVAGGMLRVGIPSYRLPHDILQAEIDQILALGIDLKLNTAVKNLDSLFKQGFSAVFLGVGAHQPMKLGIEGEDLEGVIPGEKFLMDLSLNKKIRVGKKIAVIGGGNTAIDCSRVSIREGAEKVYILYRRTRREMPAHEAEIEDALAEGVDIQFLVSPVKIIGENGKLKAIKCIRNKLGEKDAQGRRRPVPIEGSEFTIEVDTILSAISRKPEAGWLEKSGVDIHQRRGVIVADPVTGETSKPGVFSAGDASLGADIAIAAIGGGKRAAYSIDAYLSGKDIKEVHKSGFLPPIVAEAQGYPGPMDWGLGKTIKAMIKKHYLDVERVKMPKLSPDKRRTNYDQVELGLPEPQALQEGKRCLSCESKVCIGCSICAESCPTEAISIKTRQEKEGRRVVEQWDLYTERCIFCGICVENCPTRTLHHSLKYELSEFHVKDFLKHKEYLLRKEEEIEKEGWTKPHEHVGTMPILWNSGITNDELKVSAPETGDGKKEAS